MSNKTSIQFPESFEVLKNGPIDNRSTFLTIAGRDALQAGQRYEGMLTYVSETKQFYYLGNGLTNADWKVFNTENNGGGSWNKIKLPSKNNFVLKTTENTSNEYVDPGKPDYPKGVFKVRLEILGTEYNGVCFAQYDAIFFHGEIDYQGNLDSHITLIPVTPLEQALRDSYSGGALAPFYKLPETIGDYEGGVGFELNDGVNVDSEDAYLYYPSEVGELVAEVQTDPGP
ncbi:hypothetical protein [Flammeovirga sp. EKP202]|uniref:hypothetical protein n=1 Tax=Flammeovirga sp. EKP202 TaxID=2770592 RepID=UPI00165F5384|nr:hypothetical protein [Flammeovirga sp. EKP202]MBD0403213.1 hypothetical protein [Flammeovirga sp. EKP202]